MSHPERSMIGVRVVAIDPPFQPEHSVMFGLQDKHGVVDAVPATDTTTFETEIELVGDSHDLDFRGGHVHGRRGDRFLYLSWGTPDSGEPFVMFARAKIKLADIPTELLDEAANGKTDLECRLHVTNSKRQPATGTIRPPAASWHRRPRPDAEVL